MSGWIIGKHFFAQAEDEMIIEFGENDRTRLQFFTQKVESRWFLNLRSFPSCDVPFPPQLWESVKMFDAVLRPMTAEEQCEFDDYWADPTGETLLN